MKQTRLESFIESCTTVGSGFLLAWAVWAWLVAPMIKHGWIEYTDGFIITCIFTVVSLIRVYIWRRFFNAGWHRVVHGLVNKIKSKQS